MGVDLEMTRYVSDSDLKDFHEGKINIMGLLSLSVNQHTYNKETYECGTDCVPIKIIIPND